ncbi:DUF1684 domain-containing protein [Micromonospora humi]|uniref:DUF1684 domain-containing protein n=1 Tax=Micromonospora humi TaxID=745366 RepID=A0A1C5H495_9ACTN|nr:DUF1684 domain-containing protein [Micromonospora humi]SCG40814.1 hypothetical protein GA0070213_102268 [Micromonospora humi]
MTSSTATVDAFVAEWQEWHRRHEEQRADPHGFLAVTGLHWLDGQPRRYPHAPGRWRTGPEGVVVVLDDGERLVVDGREVTGEHAFGPIAERDGVVVGVGDGVVEVARRGGRDILRPRRPDHPLLVDYRGTAAYPPSPRWVLPGRFVAFAQPQPTTVDAAVDVIRHVYDAPRRIEFEVDGLPLSLTAFPGHVPGTLSVLFADATSGVTTHPAVRSVAVAEPDARGRVTLDFNRATNLPCAYTDYATCPLPPAGNRLPIPVEAGEKLPHERWDATS